MKVILEAQYACMSVTGGVAFYTVQLIKHLLVHKKHSYELTFFDLNKERNNRQWIDKYFGEFSIPLHECNSFDYRIAGRDRFAFRNRSYNDYTGVNGDIFHFFHLVPFPDNLVGQPVVTIHDMLPKIFPTFFPEYCEVFDIGITRLNRKKPIVIADSETTKADILTYTNVPAENIFVIPLAYDNEKCFPQKDLNVLRHFGITQPYLLYLGRLDARKNLIRVVDAFESVAEKYSDIKLVLAGVADNNAGNTISRINSTKYKDRIILTGYISDDQKRALYSGAIAFLFPSLYEGFGIPVLEAMACGCPVITSNLSSMPEVAGEAAILIDPYDTNQLIFEIERVILSARLRRTLIQKGLVQCKNFSWDKVAGETEEVYKNVDKR